jgi:hypothetical protein
MKAPWMLKSTSIEAHLDKLLEEGGVKVTPLVGFRLLSHPLSHLGV